MRPGFSLIVAALLGSLAAVPLFFAPAPAQAQPRYVPGVMPLDRMLPGIRRAYPGEFYDADGPTPGPDGDMHYHLKWMTPDGRIEWLDTNARTGRVMGAAPGRDTFDGPGPGRRFVPAPSHLMGAGPMGPERMGPDRMGSGMEDRRERGGDGGAFRGGGRGGYGGGRDRRGR